jgi:hypothetical protein
MQHKRLTEDHASKSSSTRVIAMNRLIRMCRAALLVRFAPIRAEGAQITQAGGTHYRSTTLQRGFAGHPAAWEGHEVRYYAHATSQ